MVIEFMHRSTDIIHHFIGYQLKFSLFYSNTKQTASRTDKKMVAIRLFNGSYFPMNRHRFMQRFSSTDIIPSNSVFIA